MLCETATNYELSLTTSKNEPIVEVLRNGKSWASPWDTNFRFGRVKAKMVIASKVFVQRFDLAENPGALLTEPLVIQPDPDLIIQLQTFPYFTKKDIPVYEPFLQLKGLKCGNHLPKHIGFGRTKATALVILMENIEVWLQSVGGWW